MEKINVTYDFVSEEEKILDCWEKNNTFEKLLEKNKLGKKYRFIDGPITANNKMGIHHAWGRSMKDSILRYKAMNGYITHYRNGFDSQGLWVEVEVEKDLGFKTKKDIEEYGLDKFTLACKDRVKKYSGEITRQSKRLGQWMNWNNSYYTYTDENILGIWHFLKRCHEKGMIKESYKPMPWCARCGTSLSEHEMSGSYHDVEHQAVFFKLPVVGEDYKALVWTTTPWTLSANVALAVNAEFDYVVVKFPKDDDKLLMCESVFKRRFKGDGEILKRFKGADLEGKEFETCFPELECQSGVKHNIVLWDEVDSEEGSGIVHVAPGCGVSDFELGNTIGLDKIVPIDELGIMLPTTGIFAGKKAQELPELVFDELKKRNKLFLVHKIKHSYPYCWRCKEDILFRLVKEWAIDVDVVREDLIKNAKTVKYYPEYQGKRMLDWLNNMGDWNISRRRFYGLPLPFYHCECGHLEVIGSKEELREKAIEPNLVDQLPEFHRPWIDEIKIKCLECGKEISRVPQVGDVWLDAGIVPYSTLKYFSDREYWKEYFPAEYVLEGNEQIRLWFYSMLFMSTVLENCAPYESIGTTSMVVKEDGTKFSKSDKNSLTFDEVANEKGSDAIRYTYLSTKPVNDVRFGFGMLDDSKKKLMAFYNMAVFFNTYASIDNVDLTGYIPELEDLTISDKWLIKMTDDFVTLSKKSYDNYETKTVCDLFERICDEISNFYIRINRRRYWKSEDDTDKLNAYYVLFTSIKKIAGVMAPIIPFMTEYIWKYIVIPCDKESVSSVHLSNFPKPSNFKIEERLIDETTYVRNIITMALKLRNEANIKVRQPLSILYLKELDNKYFDEYTSIIKSELNVKNIEFVSDFSNLKDEYLTLNFRNAGATFKQDVNNVKNALLNVQNDKELINKIKNNESIKVGDYMLNSELVNIEFKQRDDIVITEENDITVGLNINITEELKSEGILRDIIRQCQVFRKESGFNVEDRIYIKFETNNKEIENIINLNIDLIKSELLARLEEVEYTNKYMIEDDYKLTIYMSKVKNV